MAHTALTPVFVGLRTGLHVLFVALTVLVIARAVLVPTDVERASVIVLAVVLLVTYVVRRACCAGGIRPRRDGMPRLAAGSALLSVEWVVLLWLTPDAAYLVFPLFFLYLHLLGRWWGSAAIVLVDDRRDRAPSACTAAGPSAASSGPLVGAGVALLIGLGYQALAREAEQREALMAELHRHPRPARHDRARVGRAGRTGAARPRDPRHRSRRGSRASRCCCTRPSGPIPTAPASSTSGSPARRRPRTSPTRAASSAS